MASLGPSGATDPYVYDIGIIAVGTPPPWPPNPNWPGTDLASAHDFVYDDDGNLFLSDASRVLEIAADGTRRVVAGGNEGGYPTVGPASASQLLMPWGIAVDHQGDLYVTDRQAELVLKIDTAGELSIVAGIYRPAGGNSDDIFARPTPGPADQSQLFDPFDVAVDSQGDVLIADTGHDAIEKVDPQGILSVVSGVGPANDNDLSCGVPTPGPAAASKLCAPSQIIVDASDNIFFIAWDAVQKITAGGRLSVVLGDPGSRGSAPYYPDSRGRIRLDISTSGGLAIDADGNLFVSDTDNHVIDKVNGDGQVSIVAGKGSLSVGMPMPGRATSTTLNNPGPLTIAPNGDLDVLHQTWGGQGGAMSENVSILRLSRHPIVINAARPTLPSVVRVGTVVTAPEGLWAPQDSVKSFQWLLDGAQIAGATSASYRVPVEQVGKKLSVRVTATRSGSYDGGAVSAPATVIAGRLVAAAAPRITGKPRVGTALRVTGAEWRPSAAVTFQWFANGHAVRGARAARLRLTKGLKGQRVTVVVSASRRGYVSESITLAARGRIRS